MKKHRTANETEKYGKESEKEILFFVIIWIRWCLTISEMSFNNTFMLFYVIEFYVIFQFYFFSNSFKLVIVYFPFMIFPLFHVID